jgi:hypothetical protein
MIKIYSILILIWCNITIAQTEFFRSKLIFHDSDFEIFYSSINIDSNQVYFNANDYNLHAFSKKTGSVNWSYQTGSKSGNKAKVWKNNVFIGIRGNKWIQLNTKTGDTIHTLKIEGLTTQPYFNNNTMYCTAIAPDNGGVIIAYDVMQNNTIWQKYIGHGVSHQPYFFKDKIVANCEDNLWFEIDYNGIALNKNSNCYEQNTEPPYQESFCNINYNVVKQLNPNLELKYNNNQYDSDNKYYYGNTATLILGRGKIQIINKRNKVKKEISIDKIINLQETGVSNYTEILKVKENIIWFFYENFLIAYDFKKNSTLNTYDLTSWSAHQVILDGDTLWLVSEIDGQLHGINLKEKLNNVELVRVTIPTITDKINYLNKLFNDIDGNFRTPEGSQKMFYKSVKFSRENGELKIETKSSNKETFEKTENYLLRVTNQFFNPKDILAINNETADKTEPLGIMVTTLKPETGGYRNKIEKLVKQTNSDELKWVKENDEFLLTDEIGIIFNQTNSASFAEIKKTLEELKILFENY